MWDQLPELILIQIFSHLDRGDRASVSQVCRSWNLALSSPVLWRSVTVLIDRDLRGNFPLAGELAVRMTILHFYFLYTCIHNKNLLIISNETYMYSALFYRHLNLPTISSLSTGQ